MSGANSALVQLYALGDQDKPLYCSPEKTLFKKTLVPIHPFGRATMQVAMNPGSSRQAEIDIPRTCDLIQKGAVCALFPGLVPSNPDDYAYYVNGLMYNYVLTATLMIVGLTIAKEWGMSSFIYDSLFKDVDELANELTGVRFSASQLQADAQSIKRAYALELDFYCFQFPESAFPQSAVANKVTLQLTFNEMAALVITGPVGAPALAMTENNQCAALNDSSVSLWCQFDYILLAGDERDKMQSRRLFYLMRQVQRQEVSINNSSMYSVSNIELTFNHSAFFLGFIVRAMENILAKNYLNFTFRNHTDPIISAALVVSNTTYQCEQNANFLRTRNLANANLNIPRHQIYGIPFGIDCRSYQNTGTINFTFLDKPSLQLKLRNGSPELLVSIFLWVYNYFRVVRGRSGPQFNTQL